GGVCRGASGKPCRGGGGIGWRAGRARRGRGRAAVIVAVGVALGRARSRMNRIVIDGDFGKAKLPEPPETLNEEQAAIWNAVVASEPPEFFNTDALRAMLHDYCQRRGAARTLGLVINAFKPEWIRSEEGSRRYARLLKIGDLEV